MTAQTTRERMPLQNRVTPLGELIADPARGLVYGNRGCLHDARGRIRRSYAGRRWIACRLRSAAGSAGRCCSRVASPSCSSSTRRPRSPPGHRPCALCRRERLRPLRCSGAIVGAAGADAIDARLHAERIDGRAGATTRAAADLPDGAFVLRDGAPWLVLGDELLRWTPAGYTDRVQRPRGAAT